MVRRHKQMQAFNIVPTYATDAHYTTVAHQELWETLTHYNRTLHRNFPLAYIQDAICTPLWAAGVYSLSDLTTADGERIATPGSCSVRSQPSPCSAKPRPCTVRRTCFAQTSRGTPDGSENRPSSQNSHQTGAPCPC
jgi:hypothetical protein